MKGDHAHQKSLHPQLPQMSNLQVKRLLVFSESELYVGRSVDSASLRTNPELSCLDRRAICGSPNLTSSARPRIEERLAEHAKINALLRHV